MGWGGNSAQTSFPAAFLAMTREGFLPDVSVGKLFAQTVVKPSSSLTAQCTFMHSCGLCGSCDRDKSVLYFTAKWCPPCRRIGPFFAELSLDTPNVTFGKVDIDDNPDATSMAKVMSVPTFKFYKVRPLFFSSSGVRRNTRAAVTALVIAITASREVEFIRSVSP